MTVAGSDDKRKIEGKKKVTVARNKKTSVLASRFTQGFKIKNQKLSKMTVADSDDKKEE